MTVSTGDILRVVASMLWTDGNINQNVYNAEISGGGGPWDDADVVADALAWVNNMYANATNSTSNELDGNEVTVYKYDAGDDDWDEVGSDAWVWNPTQATDELPRGVAKLIRLWTVDPDVQGKKYIPGLTEAATVDGLISAADLILLLAFAADWYTPFVGGTSGANWVPGIWSVANTAFFAGVDHVAASGIAAYQRRRKRNVGI